MARHTVAANAPLVTAQQVLTSNSSEAREGGPAGRPITSPAGKKLAGLFGAVKLCLPRGPRRHPNHSGAIANG